MVKRTVCAVLCAMAALLTVSSAAYAADQWVGPAQSVATFTQSDALLREAVGIGVDYWRARGFVTCMPRVYVMDEDGVSARGSAVGCAIWFDRAYRDSIWDTYHERHVRLRERRHALEDVCQVGVHEAGHTLGDQLLRLWQLDATGHAPYGIMAPSAHLARLPECARWARAKLPRRRK